jgi:hypothetical protein
LVGPWPRLVRAVTLKLHPSGATRRPEFPRP